MNDMDFKEGLLTRRSIRNFKKGPISKEVIEDMLKIAMYAPSAKNKQPWEFIVVDDKDILHQIKENHPYAKYIEEAGHALLVCGRSDDEYMKGSHIIDCSAAVENFLLACHEKGLGACWCGVYPDENLVEFFAKTFNLPENIVPFTMVVFGHPDGSEVRQPSTRFKQERIHYNTFA